MLAVLFCTAPAFANLGINLGLGATYFDKGLNLDTENRIGLTGDLSVFFGLHTISAGIKTQLFNTIDDFALDNDKLHSIRYVNLSFNPVVYSTSQMLYGLKVGIGGFQSRQYISEKAYNSDMLFALHYGAKIGFRLTEKASMNVNLENILQNNTNYFYPSVTIESVIR